MTLVDFFNAEPAGQAPLHFAELGLALLLSTLIGLDREFRAKSAGLRTHTIVGVSAALIMLVSKYGFGDQLGEPGIGLDPSRIAAQIVSGIGFIGGGLIFVQRDVVRGLTTAAIVWLTAAIGMACGAGLPLLAIFVTLAHFVVVFLYTWVTRRIRSGQAHLVVRYLPGRGAVEKIVQTCAGSGFAIERVAMDRTEAAADGDVHSIHLDITGRRSVDSLLIAVGDLKGVVSAAQSPAGQASD